MSLGCTVVLWGDVNIGDSFSAANFIEVFFLDTGLLYAKGTGILGSLGSALDPNGAPY